MIFLYNADIRDALKANRVFGYEVAERLGMTEFSFSRMLARKELTPERKQQILEAIGGVRNAEITNTDP